MGTRTVYRTSYSFNKPNSVSENEFNKLNNSFPIYPMQENALKLTFAKYWFQIILSIIPILFLLALFTGSIGEIYNYYSTIQTKNKIMYNFYDIIYKSKTYKEYLENYKGI